MTSETACCFILYLCDFSINLLERKEIERRLISRDEKIIETVSHNNDNNQGDTRDKMSDNIFHALRQKGEIMKRRIGLRLTGIVLIMALILSACAKKDFEKSTDDSSSSFTTSYDYDMGATTGDTSVKDKGESDTADTAAPAAAEGSNGIGNTSAINAGASSVVSQDKIIRKFYMDVETIEFDSLIDKIDAEIKRLGGYVETSQISGNSIYSSDQTRFGDIVVRIPSDRVDEFVNKVKDTANVTNRSETTQNVTLEYIDMESRKEALQIEQERLFAILEKEVSLDNIVSLESRLSDIRYEIQNYESQLRYYDNLVEYSTVTLKIQEVERITPVTEEKQTTGEKIKTGFGDSMYHVGKGLENIFVWFVVNLPYLLLFGGIVALVVFFIRRYMKKSKANRKAHEPQPMIYYNQFGQGQINPGPNNQVQQNPGQQNQGQFNQGSSDQNHPNQGK
jgi:hypothetical protein